jgi:hypothetical protein
VRLDSREQRTTSVRHRASVVVLAVVCSASIAAVDGPRVRWSAPPECPSEAVLRERVAANLERPMESFDDDTSFDANVTLTEDRYRLELTTQGRGEQGARVLADDDCDALTSAAALAIAFALRANAERKATGETEPAASPAATPGSASLETRAASPRRGQPLRVGGGRPASRVVTRAPGRRWLGVEALGQADMGTLPRVSPGGAIGLELGLEPWRLEARAGLLWPIREPEQGRGGLFWLGYGELGGCARLASGARASLAGCALLEVGRLTGSGRGVDERLPGAYWWLAPGARLTSAVRLHRSGTWALAGVAAAAPLIRAWFVLNGVDRVYQPDRAAGRLELGVLQEIW